VTYGFIQSGSCWPGTAEVGLVHRYGVELFTEVSSGSICWELSDTDRRLGYPLLQAADLLLHAAGEVPAGADEQEFIAFAAEAAGRPRPAACTGPSRCLGSRVAAGW
jgi:hypothetical protein